MGPRDGGTPEDVTFERKHVRDRELDPTGKIIATLPFEGELPKGEALKEYREIVKAAQLKAEKVEKEAIPIEYRQKVRDYMKALLPAADGENGGSGTESESESSEER